MVAAGAPGAVLLPKKQRDLCPTLAVAIDLNGVPPAGVEGVEPADRGADRGGLICYGALGVGGAKMKRHKACVAALFTRPDAVFDLDQIAALAPPG